MSGFTNRKSRRKQKETLKWTKNTFTRICGNSPEAYLNVLNKFKFSKKRTCKCFKNGKKMKCSKYKWP